MTSGGPRSPEPDLLVWSRAWAIDRCDDRLTISAGADLSYEIDGLGEATVAEVASWSRGGQVSPSTDQAGGVADRLVHLGVLVLHGDTTAAVRVEGDGPVAIAVSATLDDWQPRQPPRSPTDPPPLRSLTVSVSESPQSFEEPPHRPHLLVDATGHHTVVIGPLVIPGFTACGECLRIRTSRRWPAPIIAPEPAVTRAPTVVAQLVAIQVERSHEGEGPINATIAWNLATGAVKRDDLLRVPGCASCARWRQVADR